MHIDLSPSRWAALYILVIVILSGCVNEASDEGITRIDSLENTKLARRIISSVRPEVADGLTIGLWAVDSLVADPVTIHIDHAGNVYYIRTNRRKNSEIDIRAHRDWEIASIALQTVEDKRAFLKKELAPERSHLNTWLKDYNGDGSHDWRDLAVSKEHIYRLEDTDGDGLADMAQLVLADFNTEVSDVAGALLSHEGDLFIGVGPDMWRTRDTNGDGIIDEKTSISHGYGIHIGFGGHGMSGAVVGPEGKIYWQIGDIGFNGVGPDGKRWEHPNSGVIVRANPDGSDFEVFAYGNRNTHNFVFDEYGNLISEDNDGDHRGERERLVYITNGADLGWRINWQFGKYRDPDNNGYKVWMDEGMHLPRFPGQAAYITPCIANFVDGPAGMVYNPGTALGPEWNNTFFIAEFVGNPARSGVHAFKLKPNGASFSLVEHKQVLKGVLATGVEFGPDGAMYIADWVVGWETKNRGRIWKLDVETGAANPAREETRKLLAADFSKSTAHELGALLRHDDMRVRQKAQLELARRGTDGLAVFEASIRQRDHQLARIHGIWGISQFARKDLNQARLLVPLLTDADPEIRAQAAKWIGDVRYGRAADALLPLLKDDAPRVRFFAAEALGRIEHRTAVKPIVEMLRVNNDEDAYLRHAGSLALARIGDANALLALASDPSEAVRLAAVVALRRMQHPGVAAFLNDSSNFVVTEAARAINDDQSIEDALPALAAVLNNNKFVNEALIRRAINANLRVGTEDAIDNLIAYAQRSREPIAMRVEALEALATWIRPSVVDRVDGRYRGEIIRDPEPVRKRAAEPLIELTSTGDKEVRQAAVKAIGKLGITVGLDKLMALLASDNDPDIRREALHALVRMEAPTVREAIRIAFADKQKSVRVAALDLLPKADLPTPVMVTLLNNVIRTATPEEQQAALLTLGSVGTPEAEKVVDSLLTSMENGQLLTDLYLELAEAIDSLGVSSLKERYTEVSTKLSPDSIHAAFAGALSGGNVSEGRNIFFRDQSAQCIRCHSYDDFGGNAGPRLNGIASRLSREELLEALIVPSARIAPGYGILTLELEDGRKISGMLQEETGQVLRLKIGNNPDTLISVNDIRRRINAPSSMPPMGQLLSKRQIRDLMSFLATLTEE